MSTDQHGEGWWQASDGNWYSPEAPPPPRYLVVDTFRRARRSGEVESPIAWFVLAMVLFALLAVAYYGT